MATGRILASPAINAVRDAAPTAGEQLCTDAFRRQLHPSWTVPRNDRRGLELGLWVGVRRVLGGSLAPRVNHDQFTATGRLDEQSREVDAGWKRPSGPGVNPISTQAPGPSTVPPTMSPPSSGGHMRDRYRTGAAAMLLMALMALSATVRSTAENGPGPQPQNERLPDSDPDRSAGCPAEPTVTVLDHREVQSVLGKEVRSAADENMGRIVDIIVDRTGQCPGCSRRLRWLPWRRQSQDRNCMECPALPGQWQ